MIQTKSDLNFYLSKDKKNYTLRTLGWLRRWRNDCGVTPISDQKYIWKYIKAMRYVEYYMNKKRMPWDVLFLVYYRYKLKKYGYKTGFQIAPNTIDEGLTIWHWGPIIINGRAHIGKNATLRSNIVIGEKTTEGGCPQIGDNVVISDGAKIIGDIRIGDDVDIAPNACVVKNCDSNKVYGGIPAKIIRDKNEGSSN